MLDEKTFDTGEVIISYSEGPNAGPPLVLLHGLSGRWQSMLPMVPLLSTRWHIYALDFRGHGGSGRCPGRYKLQDYLRDVEAFVDSRLDQRPAVYGHSLGGMVGIMLAAARPLRALAVGDSPLYRDTIQAAYAGFASGRNVGQELVRRRLGIQEYAAALEKMMPGRDPLAYRFIARSYAQLDPDVLVPLVSILDGYDCEALFPLISCPVLLLQADHAAPGDVVRAQAQLRDLTVLKCEGLSHDLQIDLRGTHVAWAVAKFLESL